MHKIIRKISQAVQVLLLAPIKLPVKALNIIKYVAVGLGVLEAVTGKGEEESDGETSEEVNELSSEQVNEDILSDNERVSESVKEDN